MSPTVTSTEPECLMAEAVPRCPRCDYNLTGLPEPRCPECGATFDWAAVWKTAVNPPRIAFERARGWRKVPGFVVTWVTVLFAPWVFARQAVYRMSVGHALAFVGVCLASTPFALFSDADIEFIVAWVSTALAYVLLQGIWLSVIDASGWVAWRASLRFWLLVGCYTSAVMMTEVVTEPPMIVLSDLRQLITTGYVNSWLDEAYELSLQSAVWWLQIAFWLLGLAVCYFARLRRQRWSRALCVCASLVVAVSLFLLYAAVYEWIGATIYVWFD